MITVPKLWPGETVVCIGGGPSLTPADVNAVRGHARVIAINRAFEIAPWAEVLYCADRTFIDACDGVPSFAGLKYSITGVDPATDRPGWQVLRNTGFVGLELDPTALRAGWNSGYQAINLAVHFGAQRILLLGYDMGPSPDGRCHWHPPHPKWSPSPYAVMMDAFRSLIEPLAAIGVTVVNCSRQTRLTAFPRASLDAELARLQVAA